MGPEDPRLDADWEAFRAARDRFFSRVRPEAMDEPPQSVCPDALPEGWRRDEECAPGEDSTGA